MVASRWARINSLRRVHRVVATVIAVFSLYYAVTGSLIQSTDLRAVLSGAAATDPDMKAIRESIDGPSNFAVIAPEDYTAAPLPPDYNFQAGLNQALLARRAANDAERPLRYVEWGVADGRPYTRLLLGAEVFRLDSAKGGLQHVEHAASRPGPERSWHNVFKHWHRMQVFGDGILWWNTLVGAGLLAMILTGLLMYAQLWGAARRVRPVGPFWFSGGWWRSLHRWISLVAALFLVVVAASGVALSVDSLSLFIYRVMEPPEKLAFGLFPLGMISDQSAPLADAQLPRMLERTLAAFQASQPDTPIKRLRLRTFADMPQGIVVTGGAETRQMVYDAVTGRPASMSEPGYPYTGFPFGWEEHELMKKIHRGDAFGIPGRLFSLMAGLALIFLSVSGLIMYGSLWKHRRATGRPGMFWR